MNELTQNFLTDIERVFISEYLKDGNGVRSVKIAGYKGKHPAKAANEILSRPHVAMEIARQYQGLVDRLSFGAEEFHSRLIAEVDADLGDIFDDYGSIKPISQWPKIWRQGLVLDIEYKIVDGGEAQMVKVKTANRDKKLDMLGKHRSVKAFQPEQVQIGVGDIDDLFDAITPTTGPPSERNKKES